ncbi:MAG: YIP1 family protein [Pelagibacterales bacterium]|nr:YIP1 family protein [Pelagibacterales bacterium]
MFKGSFQNRIIRAVRLDSNLYEEVEADKGAMWQAMAVVVLSSIAAGIGLYKTGGFNGIITGTMASLISWYVWAYLTYFIGTKFLPEEQTQSDLGELLRTTGFSSSPGLFRIFYFIPGVGVLVYLISSLWMLVAMIIAVRQALDYNSTLRAVGVCVIGYVIQLFVLVLIVSFFGGTLLDAPA